MSAIWAKIGSFIARLENTRVSFWEAVFLLYGIFFIRTFLENFANSGNFYHMSGVIDVFFHYPIGFSIVVIASFMLTAWLTGERIEKTAKVSVLLSFIVIIPPIIDLLINAGGQIPYIFISGSWSELLRSFVTYFGGGAVGLGIKTEVALALLGIGIYIFHKTGRIARAIAGALILYVIIFAFLSTPAILFGLQNKISGAGWPMDIPSMTNFYFYQEPRLSQTGFRTLIMENDNFAYPLAKNVQNQYSLTLAIFFLLVHAVLYFWCLFLYSSKKFFAVLKNFRFLRILHYFLLAGAGIIIALVLFGRSTINSMFDLLSFMSLFLAILFAWLFAVWENDEVDVAIDKISNAERPLAINEPVISLEEWQGLKYSFLAYALAFAFLSGLYTLTFIVLFIFLYHIYSVPPLRFKRFLGLSSLIIAANALLAVLLGFFFASGTENLNAFPLRYALGTFLIFLLGENVKNIKDIEGDKRENMRTLPVILGERKGKIAAGLGVFLAALLVPFFFGLNIYTFIAALIFGSILFRLCIRENFKEKYIFWTYFIYAFVFLILVTW